MLGIIEHVLLWMAVGANITACIWTIVQGQRRLRKMDAIIHDMENTRARLNEYIVR